MVGRLSDRRGPLTPVRASLVASAVVGVLAPLLHPAAVLVVLLVVGLPAFGTLFVPAATMISDGADRAGLHHGLAFGLGNLSWAAGQAVSAAASGALAQATTTSSPTCSWRAWWWPPWRFCAGRPHRMTRYPESAERQRR